MTLITASRTSGSGFYSQPVLGDGHWIAQKLGLLV
jgi:hypothetical protein